jgi:hypothetical protein
MRRTTRDWLRTLERAEPQEQWALLCFLAGRSVVVDAAERSAALRRAELLLAAGGDPRRVPELYGRAAGAVAADLDDPARRAALRAGLESLRDEVTGLRGASEALRLLLADEDLAWQAYAYSVLLERLTEDEPDPGEL